MRQAYGDEFINVDRVGQGSIGFKQNYELLDIVQDPMR